VVGGPCLGSGGAELVALEELQYLAGVEPFLAVRRAQALSGELVGDGVRGQSRGRQGAQSFHQGGVVGELVQAGQRA